MKESLHQFLTQLYGPEPQGYIEVRAIHEIHHPHQFWYESPEELVNDYENLQELNRQLYHIFFGVNPRYQKSGSKPDIKYVIALHTDIDAKDYDKNIDKGKTLAWLNIQKVRPLPNLLVGSGNGYHSYWVLKEPFEIKSDKDIETIENINKKLAYATKGDSVSDITRILRLPCFNNPKNPKKLLPVKWKSLTERPYNHTEFEHLPEPEAEPLQIPENDQILNNMANVWRNIIKSGDVSGYRTRSERDFAVICYLISKHYPNAVIGQIFDKYKVGAKFKESGNKYLNRQVQKAREWIQTRPGREPAVEEPIIPMILETGAELLKKELVMQEYLWDEIIGQHKIVCLAAKTGVGKTMLSHQILICLAMGVKTFLRFEMPEPRRVLFLNFECSEQTFLSRHQLICTSFPEFEGGSLENFYVNTFSAKRHLFQDNWKSIRATVETNPKFDLICIDNIYASTDVDDERNYELKQLLTSIVGIADIHKSSIILVAHHKKHVKELTLEPDLIRGGSTLTNAADVVVQMAFSQKQQGLRIFKITKNRDRSPNLNKAYGLHFDPIDLWFSNNGLIDEVSHLTEPKRLEALSVLDEMGDEFETPQFVRFTIDNLGKTERTAHNWLKKLEKLGKVGKLEHGKYGKLVK